MDKCEVCGNQYEDLFEVRIQGDSHWFDSFECAIHALAPVCVQCHVKIVGHGIEASGEVFCCANCARVYGIKGVVDHLDMETAGGQMVS